MKLLLKEYIAALKERDELDALLPDLLSEMGWTVFLRPSRGPRQFGVDMAACGEVDGVRKVYLFTLKAGNLTRSEWHAVPQGVRASLDQIRDTYLPDAIPPQYAGLPIVICLVYGGELAQAVEKDLRGYFKNNKKRGRTYDDWNGDRLANMLMSGALREHLLPKESRALFRKSVALVDEPDVSVAYFGELVTKLIAEMRLGAEVSVARRITICLWVLYVWARESENGEAPYVASELALLRVWKLAQPVLAKKRGKSREDLIRAIDSLVELHLRIARDFALKTILPLAKRKHALSAAVRSSAPIDINQKLFDVLGRVALCGLWMQFIRQKRVARNEASEVKLLDQTIRKCVHGVADMINNNPVLKTPIRDDQITDITLAMLLLYGVGETAFLERWVSEMVGAIIYGYRSARQYPCVFQDPRDLARHPKSNDEPYKREATAASVLYPTLASWALILRQSEAMQNLSEFLATDMEHCALQLWFPGANSEEQIYTSDAPNGITLMDIAVQADGNMLVRVINEECVKNKSFEELSAMRWGIWPLVMMACRHNRFPLPPNFWVTALPAASEPDGGAAVRL
jgi:hypothetical protein